DATGRPQVLQEHPDDLLADPRVVRRAPAAAQDDRRERREPPVREVLPRPGRVRRRGRGHRSAAGRARRLRPLADHLLVRSGQCAAARGSRGDDEAVRGDGHAEARVGGQPMILDRFKVPEHDQVLVSEAAVRRTVTQIFEKLGLTPEDAADGADVLTMADLRGVETHGVSNMLRLYVRDYKAGKLTPKPGLTIVRQSPGTAVIDAERRLGNLVGAKAMRLAI